ncbi:hypothetical protein V2J09_000945 [Rumex salicifolius]
MAISASSSAPCFDLTNSSFRRHNQTSPFALTYFVDTASIRTAAFPRLTAAVPNVYRQSKSPMMAFPSGGGGEDLGGGIGGRGGGGGGGDSEGGSDGGDGRRKEEALLALAQIGRSLDSFPKDFVAAVQSGRVPVEIVTRFAEMDKSTFYRWLLHFSGFRERLLADDLFLAKVAMECGVGVFTKTLAEYERRRENFFKEIEIVCADVAMAVIADFMLVYLPAPTVAFRPALAVNAGSIVKFFHGCPDNAFQVAFGGASYSLLQRLGAILRNGTKLFAVGTASSLVGTSITNVFINAKKSVDKSCGEEIENVPVLSTSVAYGVYMAVSSNLRYQILGGLIEQRILEPMLHNNKVMLSALCFAVRTGNTFLGSLLWVDYARLIGIQGNHAEEHAA